MTRSHLYLPLTDSSGAVYPFALVTLTDETGAALSFDTFVQPSGGNPVVFPLFVNPAVIDVWLSEPVRAQIVAEVSDNTRIVLDGVDILPVPDVIVQSPGPISITGSAAPPYQAALMSAAPGEAVFRVTDPVGTHQHPGDSAGSVVLTREAATDFNPYQSWVGYHAGENGSPNSAGSSAFGSLAEVYGASATILGVGEIAAQTSTGMAGDTATVLSSEDSNATANSTVIGAANLTVQGRDMTVLGSVNGPSSPGSVPNGATVIGPGNVIGAAGAVKIGASHPASNAGDNHTTIGVANTAQQNGLPWAGVQTPIALGSSKTLAGDPSDVASADDWFGGAGPLASGVNDPAFNPSLIALGNDVASQVALRVNGDAILSGHRTYAATSTTLGFYGAVGVTRPQVAVDVSETGPMLTSLLTYLSKAGLIYTTANPVLTESGTHPDGTALEFAETGQALQWKLPPTSVDYRAANAFTVASNRVVLNAALAPFPTHGVPALYSCGRADVSVQGRFGYSAATSGFPDSDLYTGLMIRTYLARSIVGGQTVAVPTGYLVGRSAVYSVTGNTIGSTVATLSTKPAAGDLLQADCTGTSVTVRVNGTSVATFTDSTLSTRVKHGYRLMPGTSAWGFQVFPFGF